MIAISSSVHSVASAQLWAPPKMLTGVPLVVIYKNSFRRYASSRGRMDFKTKYHNCRHNFGSVRPVVNFQVLGVKCNFRGKDFYHMFKQIF